MGISKETKKEESKPLDFLDWRAKDDPGQGNLHFVQLNIKGSFEVRSIFSLFTC
jgi:hypothetical protein